MKFYIVRYRMGTDISLFECCTSTSLGPPSEYKVVRCSSPCVTQFPSGVITDLNKTFSFKLACLAYILGTARKF